MPVRAVFRNDKNIEVFLAEVTDIDRKNCMVICQNGQRYTYDYLVLAPGSRYNYFGNNQWEENAPSVKSLGDALRIRERILYSLEKAEELDDPGKQKPYLTYVVIGGGPTGVETAGAISDLVKRNMIRDYKHIDPNNTRVLLMEAGPRLLAAFPEKLSEKALQDLQKMGVQVLLNTKVTSIKRHEVTANDQVVTTPNIIWAAGVKASHLLSKLNAEQDKSGRVKVTNELRLPDDPHIFVIGDSAFLIDDRNNRPLPALAPVAMQQGRYVAKLILSGKEAGQYKPFIYTDKGNLATIGRVKAIAEIGSLKLSGFPAWITWVFVHIFFLIGFRNRFRVMAEWIWYYITFRRGVRLITERDLDNLKG
jgi:NADH dehydrogenase